MPVLRFKSRVRANEKPLLTLKLFYNGKTLPVTQRSSIIKKLSVGVTWIWMNCEKLTFQNSKMKKGFEDFQRLNLDQLGEIIVRDLCEDYYRKLIFCMEKWMVTVTLMTTLCWWQNHFVENYFVMLEFFDVLNRPPTSYTCHQHILSPTSVTNIDVVFRFFP